MKRRRAERGGRRAETLAAWWLQAQGLAILALRARTPVGEVDLVARRGRITRLRRGQGARHRRPRPRSALDDYRLRRVAAPPRHWRLVMPAPGDDIRIDAMFIVPWRFPRHLTNITQG